MSRAKTKGLSKYVKIELVPGPTDSGSIHLVAGGRNAYLWFASEHCPNLRGVGTASGAAALRALARAILEEVPPPKTKKRALLK